VKGWLTIIRASIAAALEALAAKIKP